MNSVNANHQKTQLTPALVFNHVRWQHQAKLNGMGAVGRQRNVLAEGGGSKIVLDTNDSQ